MNKCIAIYTQGGKQSAVFRYRFFQYFDRFFCNTIYHKRLSDQMYKKYMPISEHNILTKIFVYLYMCIRVSYQIISDYLKGVDVIIISRVLVKKKMPFYFQWLLRSMKRKGVLIIWDFDDNILESGELSASEFYFFADVADKIIIASSYLAEILPGFARMKILVLSTTDGEILRYFSNKDKLNRKATYRHIVKVLWVGTSSSLNYVKEILPQLEKAGEKLRELDKELIFTLVCNKTIKYEAHNFNFKYIVWDNEVAKRELLHSHIGLMPLDNSIIAKGKGGFKLIQYLSVSLPSIVSSVGINKQILKEGGGFLVDDLYSNSWSDAIVKLGVNYHFWETCSCEAKNIYDKYYSFESNLKVWEQILHINE